MSNPCVRCGKERVDGKTWTGQMGASNITYTMTICPDADCQKIVDQEIADRKAKSEAIQKAKNAKKAAKESLTA